MWNKLEKSVAHYFGFSNSQARGTLVLLFVLTALISLPLLLKEWYNPMPFESLPAPQQQDLNKIADQLAVPAKDSVSETPKEKKESPKIELFAFDPNAIGIDDWKKLGVEEKMAQRILKYMEKGGRFRIKSDLQKIYDFPENLYAQLEPYITLPNEVIKEKGNYSASRPENLEIKPQGENVPPTSFYPKKEKITSLELNEADTLILQKVKGIGSVLSSRIVRFREKLGGFHSIDQLNEIYGLEGETLETLKKISRLSNANIRKIDINKANEKLLASHPYISPPLAKIIINYRKQHGGFSSAADLHKIRGISHEVVDRIEPYLNF